MQKRAVRLSLLALLLVAGAGAALLAWNTNAQLATLAAAEQDVAARIDRIVGALGDAVAAQHAYVAPGQPDEPSFERLATLVQQVYTEAAALRPRAQSVEAAGALQSLNAGVGRLIEADSRTRENLRFGQELMAADLIFGESQQMVSAMQAGLRDLRAAEMRAFDAQRASLVQRAWTVTGAVALLWLLGLALLVRVPAPAATIAAAPAAADPAPAEEAPPAAPGMQRQETQTAVATPQPPPVDLAAAAELCTDLSRVNSTAALNDLLPRAAAILDASGLIVWMGAGEELFAVTAHGYDPRVISRLGPITRNAENATAAAWRGCEVRTVPGDMMSHGAIVAPMYGPDACIGVLAAEVRNGRESDPATRAVTSMIAAQLATIVAAWPAASAPADAAATSHAPADATNPIAPAAPLEAAEA